MRIRQIKPSFWSDVTMADLPGDTRLFYIGTWQLADDGGWFEWNVPEIAVALYPYTSRGRRERWVADRADALVKIGRLRLEDCGHAFVVNLTQHQKFGGRPVETVTLAHARDCARLRANDPHGKERVEVGVGRVRKGEVTPEKSSHIRRVDGKFEAVA